MEEKIKSQAQENVHQQAETDSLNEEILYKEEKIAYLNRQIQENNKNINHIKQSKTWKLSKYFRRIKKFFRRLFNSNRSIRQKQYIEQLKLRLSHAEDELYQTREKLHELRLKDLNLNHHQINEYVKDMRSRSELISHLDTFIDTKNHLQSNYREALTHAAKLYMRQDDTYKNLMYSKVLSGLAIEEIPEFIIRAGLTEKPIPLHEASSFRASLNMRMRQKQLNNTLPEWYLDDKSIAYKFVEKLGVKVPHIDEQFYTINTIPKREGTVIKPVDGAGSRGVYLVHRVNEIFDVKDARQITDWDTLKQNMQQDLLSDAVSQDRWMVEELIYENKHAKTQARDVKFYCFYGKVGIILEIIRYPELRQCWWTPEGKRISTGKYDENLFKGSGATEEEIQMVENISGKIPAPFIRIDFLRGDQGLVFGEFTPKPGYYDEFDEQTDKWLGDYFLDAQGRLINDLLNGKQFSEYRALLKDSKQLQYN